jgi:hypothetical protein
MSYEQKEIVLEPTDSALLYSDGLVEAHDSRGEMFGFPRLRERVAEYAEESLDVVSAATDGRGHVAGQAPPAVLALSGCGYADFHTSVNFAFWGFSEVRLYGILRRSSPDS